MRVKTVVPLAVIGIILTISTIYFEFFKDKAQDPNLIEGSGTIEVTEIEISSKIAGRIIRLPVQEGKQVKKGDLLAELDHDTLQAQLEAARAHLENAEQLYLRVKTLYNAGSQSTQEYENALSKYKVARANYRLIAATINDALLYAPLDGTVLKKNLELGEMAFPGSSILMLGDLTNPWMKIYVPEKQLGLVKIGQNVEITVDSFPEKTFSARVTAISDQAEFTPKTIQTKEERVKLLYAVKISISNPDEDLKPGMPADARIEIGR
jgi:HlyD family secretion protein